MSIIIGVVGPICSGKGIISSYLLSKGFIPFSFSNEVREEVKKRGLPIEREILQNVGNEMRKKYGNGYWAKRIIDNLKKEENYLIEGIRNPGEVEELRKLDNFVLIGINADVEKRVQWIIKRNKDSDPKTVEEINKIESRDRGIGEPSNGQQVWKTHGMADYFIENEGSLEEFEEKVRELVEKLVD